MRALEGDDGLAGCCAQITGHAQSRAKAQKKAPSTQVGARCSRRVEFVRLSGIFLCYFSFAAAAAICGSETISMDQIAPGRMYMLAR